MIQWAFDYVTTNDGINTAGVYPYVGKASALTAWMCVCVTVCVVFNSSQLRIYHYYHPPSSLVIID